MNAAQIKRIMNGAGVPLNTPTQIPELRTIIAETNHGIDTMRDLITIDSTNGLIKIKERQYQAVNGKIIYTTETDGTLRNEKGNIFKLHPQYRFRAPKAGDVVYLADRTTGVIQETKYTITVSGMSCIVLDRPLESYDKSKYALCYSTANLLAEATESPENPLLLIKYTPVSDFTNDVYIDTEFISGLEMRAVNRLTLS